MDGSDHHHDHHHHEDPREVVIVGGGIAGLVCAKELLSNSKRIHVRLVEATGAVGGRIKRSPDGKHDLGAELVHGSGHELWEMILDYQSQGLLPTTGSVGGVPLDHGLEPFFLTAHADGGPDEKPTIHGKYGAYYLGGALVHYDDPQVQHLQQVLEEVLDPTKKDLYTDQTSLKEALESQGANLSHDLYQLCVAGYGNTAGSSDLGDLSVQVLLAFEQHWETHEIAGDYRTTFGMHAVVETTLQILQDPDYQEAFSLHLNTPVEAIEPFSEEEEEEGKVMVHCHNGTSFSADAVVVAVPPTRLPQLFERSGGLPQNKRRALEHIGFARVTKIFCFFDRPLWPTDIQSVVASDQPIPELWFQPTTDQETGAWEVVSYLASSSAANLAHFIQRQQQDQPGSKETSREALATNVVVKELSTIFGVPLEEVQQACLAKETLFCDWKEDCPYIGGGYVFPKPGMTTMDLQALAEPLGPIKFAGEATNTHACCTVQAALQTGIRAAHEILHDWEGS